MGTARRQRAGTGKASQALRSLARSKRITRALVVFILVVGAFALGFAIRSNTALMASLGVPMEEVKAAQAAGAVKTTYEAVSERVGEVEDVLSTNSMESLDLAVATNTMLADLMKSTGDPYAEYYDPERYEAYIKETADRKYSGVGVLFGDYNGRAYAIDVLPGSEAEARGVAQGDFVQAIDGDSSHAWSMTEVIGALAREEGSNVVITWLRPISPDATTGTEFSTTLVCREYEQENVSFQLEGEVGYIRLRQITSATSSLVRDAVTDLTQQGALSFVLDIRDNPGGYLTQSIDTASLFVPSGVIVGIETNSGVSTRVASGTPVTDAPLVVIMNGYTCAAAEVLAAALQDNQRAVTVGMNTMGKGSVQVVRELTFGGAVRYTAAYYLTPSGHDINDAGIAPDVSVGNGEGDEGDAQLLVALDTARSLAAG